jgi:CubicO group peptidase (beta-lactamase class C family)
MNGYQLKRSTPEEQGVDSNAVIRLLEAIELNRTQDMDQDIHSLMILRHGTVIAEGWWGPYRKDLSHILFSLSKSFTSTAIGFAVSEGLLSVEDKVTSYFREECPQPSGYLEQMRIKHLLGMSTGHVVDTTDFFYKRQDGNWAKAFLSVPVEKEPGTHFLYNTGATYMLSVILQRVTGLKLIDYLQPRLFEPLGIENPVWDECPMGYNTGGFGLSIRTEDIARFGLLYLNKGVLEGQQILQEDWIAEATACHISNGDDPESDWAQGYGYQFWRCRNNCYRGDGAFGQYCIVMPELDMVIAATSGVKNMQLPLNLIWDNLLSGVKTEVLPESEASDLLKEKLKALQVLLPEGAKNSDLVAELSGKSFKLEENLYKFETVVFEFETGSLRFQVTSDGQKNIVNVGIGEWTENTIEIDGRENRVMLTGIWLDHTTLLIQCRFIETPFAHQLKFTFNQDNVVMKAKHNVGFETPEWLEVSGVRSI